MRRHLGHTVHRVGAAAAAVTISLPALLAWGGSVAAAIGLVVATAVAALSTCRILAAVDADRADERWLRRVLAELDAGEDLPPLPAPPVRGRSGRAGGRAAAFAAGAAAGAFVPLLLLGPPIAAAIVLVIAVTGVAIALPRMLAAGFRAGPSGLPDRPWTTTASGS